MASHMKPQVETSYHSISSSDNDNNDRSDSISNRPKIELGAHPQMTDHRSWFSTIFWQTFALLWLVPVIALLYLNFTEFVIGASAWCPGGKCYLNAFNYDTAVPQERMKGFDKEDHNLLGGLQFVAKGLEVWFGIIAAALMYLITMRIAGKKEGLPVGYLTRPMEFADVVALADPLFWKTGPSPLGIKSAGEKRLGRRVWALIALSVFLCILINLMGPATAVLVIPALSWIETGYVGSRQFSNLNAAQPPVIGFEGWLWWATYNCIEEDFLSQDYSCTQDPFGNALDTWTQSAVGVNGGNTGFTQQSGLTFQTNETYYSSTQNSLEQTRQINSGTGSLWSDVVWWAPSRQIVSNLSIDQAAVSWLSVGLSEEQTANKLTGFHEFPDPVETYVEYNKSLELQIRRNGPVIGTMMNKYVDYNNEWHYSIDVDAGRQVRCYVWYNLWNAQLTEGVSGATLNYTKCIRTGSGWSNTNKHAKFYAAGEFNAITKRQGPGVTVDIFSSDRAVFLPNGTLPSWFPGACIAPGAKINSTNCDWNRLFTADLVPDLTNRTQNINTIEFTMQKGNFSTTMAVDFNAYLAFTDYTLDPFLFSNPLGLVQTDSLPNTGTSFPIDPAWLLAGWSVGHGGTLLANRTTTTLLIDVMSRLLVDTTAGANLGIFEDDYKIDYVSFLPIMHTLSMIDHSTTPVPEGTKTTDEAQPVLLRNGRMYVWAYGLGSRTSYLGAAVAIAGVLVVVWQFFLGIIDRRQYRSPTQLVVASLEHSPRGEFEGKQHDELAMARVRFHIKDDSSHSGKYSFYENREFD